MQNEQLKPLIDDLVKANEAELKKHGMKNVKWDVKFILDGDEEIPAIDISGAIGERD